MFENHQHLWSSVIWQQTLNCQLVLSLASFFTFTIDFACDVSEYLLYYRGMSK